MRKAERESVLRSYREKRQKERELRNRSNLYVRWIGDTIASDEELQKEFGLFGTVTSAKVDTVELGSAWDPPSLITPTIEVMQDEHGCSRQFGFVAYERVDDAKQALQAMNGKSINGRPIIVAMYGPSSCFCKSPRSHLLLPLRLALGPC
jgi:polyadenylate-binding protein